jgi:GDP-L-fucose synthase
MKSGDRIFVAGHRGLVGSAIARRLEGGGYGRPILRARDELDLLDGLAVNRFMIADRPEFVFCAAAKVGGILANSTYPADFIRENLGVQFNLIDAAYRHGVEKLLFLGSVCIYPKWAPQPIKEGHLLTGELEPTNEPYAIAKIAGIKMCQAYNRQYGTNFISVMPTNLYGAGDNFDLNTSHVLPAMIRKFHDAKVGRKSRVTLWGTGTPRREFLHADDLADACLFLMNHHDGSDVVNVGSGADISISDLAQLIREVVEYDGQIVFDTSRPDGTHRRLLDCSRLNDLGWTPRISLRDGIESTYRWYVSHFTPDEHEVGGSAV